MGRFQSAFAGGRELQASAAVPTSHMAWLALLLAGSLRAMRRVFVPFLLVVACALSACGGDDEKTAAAPTTQEACVILSNGNKLCGQDAKTYCEKFAVDTADSDTASACIAVGADVTSPEADAQEAEDESEEAKAKENRDRQAAAARFKPAVKKAAGKDNIDGSPILAVETSPGDPSSIIISTFWFSRDEKNDPDADPDDKEFAQVPSKARLERVCAAVKSVDPAVKAVIKSDGNEILSTCD